jgi:hypothetical protein
MGNMLGITTSSMRNPPEEGDSGGNDQLIDEESTRGRRFHRELPAILLGFRPKKFKIGDLFKIENKPDSALL